MHIWGFSMSEARKTRPITFNIKDRGRIHTGVSRSNVNYEAWIELINSPVTQEMVETGSLIGYYGHQFRELYGLQVPETVIIDGKQVSISPAVRTIELKCDADGNVTHRQEFLDNPFGDEAMKNYKAKVGGFSAVNDYKKQNGIIYPTVSFGFDYVLQANYATNIGDGQLLLDGIHGAQIKHSLEQSLLMMCDSIFSSKLATITADQHLERALQAEQQLLEINAKAQRRLELQQVKQENMLDSALCPTLDLNEYLNEGKKLMLDGVVTNIEPKEKKKKPVVVNNAFGWFDRIF